MVDTDRIKSSYDNGVLLVTLPIAEQKKKKEIKINVTGPEAISPKLKSDRRGRVFFCRYAFIIDPWTVIRGRLKSADGKKGEA
jgi:hypothetical protein